MLTRVEDSDGARTLTVHDGAPTLDVDALQAVLDDAERGGLDNLVFEFGGAGTVGDFPTWAAEPGRPDMRYAARWDEALSRLSRLSVKTFAAYDGRVGAAAVHLGLVVDLRLASARARLSLGDLAEGRFPGMGAYWLPKFVGLGAARRIFLLGEDLTAEYAERIGLVDVVADTAEAAVAATLKATRAVTPEAASFTRRILDESYLMERGAAVELAKAARYKLGMG